MTWNQEQRRDVPPQAGPVVYPWQYYAAPAPQWSAPAGPPAAPAQAPALPGGGVQKLAYSVDEAAQALGVSRSSVYNMIHMSGFPSMKIRGRRLIAAELLAEWVRRQAEEWGGSYEP